VSYVRDGHHPSLSPFWRIVTGNKESDRVIKMDAANE